MTDLLIRRMPLRTDLLLTIITVAAVILGLFLFSGLISRHFGLDTLGDYLLVRRTALSLMPFLLVGMNIGLPYFIPRKDNAKIAQSSLTVFLFLTLPLLLLTWFILSAGIIPAFPTNLALPLVVFSGGYCLHALNYGLLRGKRQMVAANLSQLITTGIMPLVVYAILSRHGLSTIISGIGFGVGTFSAIAYLLNLKSNGLLKRWIWGSELIDYGTRRFVSIISQFVLLAGTPLLMLSYVERAGIAYFNAGLAMLRISLLVLTPIGIILLPRISAALDSGRSAEVGSGLAVLGRTILMISVPGAALIAFNSDLLLHLWLGRMAEGGAILTLLMFALPAYMMQEIFRAPIDAASQRGTNSLIYALGAVTLPAVFFLLMQAGRDPLMAGITAFISAYWVVAIIMIGYSVRMLQVKLFESQFLFDLILFWSVVVGGVLLSKYALPPFWAFLTGGLILTSISVTYFLRRQSSWLDDMRTIFLIGKQA